MITKKHDFEHYRDEMISDICELINIESVQGEAVKGCPYGANVNKALQYVLEAGKKMGFRAASVDGYAGYVEYGNKKCNEHIGVLAHVDVVPAGEHWQTSPFKAIVKEGAIYGRGAIDDKGPLMASIYALKAIKDNGGDLKKNIRIIIGTNEENEWSDIAYYLKKEKAPGAAFTPDGLFPVIYGEKGILDFDLIVEEARGFSASIIKTLKGGTARNSVPDFCEMELCPKDEQREDIYRKLQTYCSQYSDRYEVREYGSSLVIKSFGISAHSATPEEGRNAITQMMKILEEVCKESAMGLPIWANQFIDVIGLDYYGEKLGCRCSDELSGSLRMNPGKAEIHEGRGTIECNIRYPITAEYTDIKGNIEKSLDESVFQYKKVDHLKPICMEKDSDLINGLWNIYREHTGDAKHGPIVVGGGTYARTMPITVAFGPVYPGQKEVAHQADEYISINHLKSLFEIYYDAMVTLAQQG
ncbi:MAG: dipeptidase PepV [Firmicutes bacterium]|jgi:succinyl-diaminopimelate desuccinylase|nr:dipeptidase PepV [Bacillota bacterium]